MERTRSETLKLFVVSDVGRRSTLPSIELTRVERTTLRLGLFMVGSLHVPPIWMSGYVLFIRTGEPPAFEPERAHMIPQPLRLLRLFVMPLFLMAAGSSFALAQTSDANQNRTYGVWKVPNPQTPGLQFRAKCNDDITDSQGRAKSEWNFQFRSTYKGTIDFVYLNEAGIAQPPANKMIGPFLKTLKPGEVYESGGELYGGCGQHGTLMTGIHVTIKCAVPTGQDAPCFKDAKGNPYPQAPPSDAQTSTPKHYGFCIVVTTDPNKPKQVIATNVFETDLDRDELYELFKKWEVQNHPELGTADDPNLILCASPWTIAEAAQRAVDGMVESEEKSGDSVLKVSWSPK